MAEVVMLPSVCRILTSNGYIAVGCAPKTGRMWTGNEWRAYRIGARGRRNIVLCVTLKNGLILRVSREHHVLVLRRGVYTWVSASALDEGDLVCMSLVRPLVFGSMPRGSDLRDFYWMGYAVGNGSSADVDRNQLTVCFGNRAGIYTKEEKSSEFIQFLKAVHQNNGQKPCVFENKISVSVASASFRASWERLGYRWGKTAHTKRVPLSVWTAPLDARKAFLLGLLEADGSIATANAALHLCQRGLLEDTQLLLRTVGVESTLRGPYRNGAFTSWRLDLIESQSRKALGYGRDRRATKISRMPASNAVVEALAKVRTATASHKVIKSRAKKTGIVSVYTARDMFEAAHAKGPTMYAVSPISSFSAEGPADVHAVRTSAVTGRYDADGMITMEAPFASRISSSPLRD